MHEGDAVAVHVALLPALPEHARAVLAKPRQCGDIVHAQAEMVDAAWGFFSRNFRDGESGREGSSARCGHSQLDVGKAHALLLVHLTAPISRPYTSFSRFAAASRFGTNDGDVDRPVIIENPRKQPQINADKRD